MLGFLQSKENIIKPASACCNNSKSPSSFPSICQVGIQTASMERDLTLVEQYIPISQQLKEAPMNYRKGLSYISVSRLPFNTQESGNNSEINYRVCNPVCSQKNTFSSNAVIFLIGKSQQHLFTKWMLGH